MIDSTGKGTTKHRGYETPNFPKAEGDWGCPAYVAGAPWSVQTKAGRYQLLVELTAVGPTEADVVRQVRDVARYARSKLPHSESAVFLRALPQSVPVTGGPQKELLVVMFYVVASNSDRVCAAVSMDGALQELCKADGPEPSAAAKAHEAHIHARMMAAASAAASRVLAKRAADMRAESESHLTQVEAKDGSVVQVTTPEHVGARRRSERLMRAAEEFARDAGL